MRTLTRFMPVVAATLLAACSLRIGVTPTATWEVVPTFLVTASPTPTGSPDGTFTTTLDADWLSPTAPVILPTPTPTPTLPPGVTPSLTPSPTALPTPGVHATLAAAPLECLSNQTQRVEFGIVAGSGYPTADNALAEVIEVESWAAPEGEIAAAYSPSPDRVIWIYVDEAGRKIGEVQALRLDELWAVESMSRCIE